jgi:hypothetical protein
MLQQLQYVTKHRIQAQETSILSMDITSLAPVFTVLACGMVATMLGLSVELAIWKWRKQKQATEQIMTEHSRK